MRVVDVVQGSDEWLIARVGCITASHVADVMAKLKRKDGESAARANYKLAKVAERLTGLSMETYVSKAMEWGTEYEPMARAAYEVATGNLVDRTGFVYHPTIKWAGASPDGLVGIDGLIECKCPNTTTHLEWLLADVVPAEYKPQMLWQMECCERQWCDFVSYDPRLPDHLQLFIKRFPRDDKAIAEIREEVIKFNAEIQALIDSLPKKSSVSPLEHQLAATLGITEADLRL